MKDKHEAKMRQQEKRRTFLSISFVYIFFSINSINNAGLCSPNDPFFIDPSWGIKQKGGKKESVHDDTKAHKI